MSFINDMIINMIANAIASVNPNSESSEYLSSCMIPDLLRIVFSYTDYCDRKQLDCPEDTGLYLNNVVLTNTNIHDINRMTDITIKDVPLPPDVFVNLRTLTITGPRRYNKIIDLTHQIHITTVNVISTTERLCSNVFVSENTTRRWRLDLSNIFNHPLELPPPLAILDIGHMYEQLIALPPRLTTLSIGDRFNQQITLPSQTLSGSSLSGVLGTDTK